MSRKLSSQISNEQKIAEEIVSKIIQKKYDPGEMVGFDEPRRKEILNTKLENGMTLLHMACAHDDLAAVHCFLECGANVNARNNCGETPLYFTKKSKIVDQLFCYGADIKVVSKLGMTAFKYALLDNRSEIVKYMLDKNYVTLEQVKIMLNLSKGHTDTQVRSALVSFMLDG